MTLLATGKIKSLQELLESIEEDKRAGYQIVHCHGVFDLVHPGHVKHFQSAKQKGDRLIVSITADKYVNKGPNRPIFTEQLRAENLAALEYIDYVYINYDWDAVDLISKIKPHFYSKGMEYKKHEEDITGKIGLECAEVKKHGGETVYTNEIVFSSSNLLNNYFSEENKAVRLFLERFKQKYSFEYIYKAIESFKNLSVLVIGDTIIDEYVYVDPMGQSGKGIHMVAKTKRKEAHIGGACIIANHLSSFVKNIKLLSLCGNGEFNKDWIHKYLHDGIETIFAQNSEISTLTKRRYVLRDGASINKLFETYSEGESQLTSLQTKYLCEQIKQASKSVDLILVADFGNGFINEELRKCLASCPNFLAVNTQVNSGNRGYHVITHYDRADYISINEPELRLATHSQYGDIHSLVKQIAPLLKAKNISITRGVAGVVGYEEKSKTFSEMPALSREVADRVGAGDCFLSLSALPLCKKLPVDLAMFLGSIAAALNIQYVGNSQSISKTSLLKYITTLLK